MNKRFIATFAALLIALSVATAPPALAASLPAQSKSSATEEVKNAGTVFEGYTVTITDSKTPAVLAGGIDWPITKLYFFAHDGEHLGSISGAAYHSIMDKYKVIGEGGAWDAPGSNGEWEFWFAERFNEYRDLTDGSGSTSTNKQNSTSSASPSQKSVDTDAYAHEVITLTNQEREAAGLHTLEMDDSLMKLAQIRAEEVSTLYSHERPDGSRVVELGYGENVGAKGSASRQVASWMNSDGHKTNILRDKYDKIGVGCFVKNGTFYWVQIFSRDTSRVSNPASANDISTTAYCLNSNEITLTAGETFQLAIENAENASVEWSTSKLSDGILSVDSDGYITTYHRSGMSSAKATLTVTAKIYVADRLVKTLNCKVTVTQ